MGVWGLGFGVSGLRVWGLGFRVAGLGFRVQGFGVQALGFRVEARVESLGRGLRLQFRVIPWHVVKDCWAKCRALQDQQPDTPTWPLVSWESRHGK